MSSCRSELRRQIRLERRADRTDHPLDLEMPEQAAILGEEHRDVLAALSRLPRRQREALVLRYFLELPEAEKLVEPGRRPGAGTPGRRPDAWPFRLAGFGDGAGDSLGELVTADGQAQFHIDLPGSVK